MKRRRLAPALWLLAPTLVVAAGCRLPQASAQPRYWVLAPLDGPRREAPPERRVGVGPVALPAYLDRPGLVTRPAANRLEVARFDLWAEPLHEALVGVLARNLEVLAPGTEARPFPGGGRDALTHRLELSVERFEAGPEGAVLLEASWTLRAIGEEAPVARGREAVREPLEGDGAAAVVAGMTRAAAELSRRLAPDLAAQGGDERLP